MSNKRNFPLFLFCMFGLFGAIVIAFVLNSYGRLL